MPKYKIRGIDVDFPYEAYDCQLVYMEKVIQSLQEKSNALLESPTGTGKTLCILCATLAWRKSLGDFSRGRRPQTQTRGSQYEDEDLTQSQYFDEDLSQGRRHLSQGRRERKTYTSEFPIIIYATRTHSQIRQVIQELKRCRYRPKMVVLGSREQLCIHDQVSLLRGKAQTNACQALCKKRTKRYCGHFSRVAEFVNKNPNLGDEPIDIEDMVNIGKSSGPCPYYLSREIHKDVDILFAPYNYLIDRSNRKSLKIDWNRSILIFDEAHNVESLCADAASFDLPSGLLTACITEAKTCIDLSLTRREMSSDQSCKPDDFAILKALLLKLDKRIAEVPIVSKELGFTKPGPYMYELLSELNITSETASGLISTIEKGCILLEEDATGSESGGLNKTEGTVCRLESLRDFLSLIFRDNRNSHAQYYKVHVHEVESWAPDAFRGKPSRTLSWWCFNPGIAMEEFSELCVGSIILTSGTLSPLDSFAEELKLEFPIRLENPHVISGDQIWAGVAAVGPSGYSFNSSYRSRDSTEYKMELGNAIVNFARIVPDGLLIFFPSYYLLEQCISCWKTVGQQYSTTVWERICKHKLPVVEPRQSSSFPSAIEEYTTKLKDPSTSGAIFFAVCRGKVSEGLDFADQAGRAVVITGLPFTTMTDPKVRLKREFLDQQIQSKKMGIKGLTGEEWYSQQASRAVNQAVGRVIRHRHDYGAIIFCDERFTYSNRQSQISSWIRPHIKCYSKFGDIAYTLTRFFRDGGVRGPTKVEMTRNVDKEDTISTPSPQLMDKFHPENLLVPQTISKTVDQTFSLDSSSSSILVKKQGNSSVQHSEIVPANRSFLTSDKPFKKSSVLCSGDQGRTGNKYLISGNNNIIDLDTETDNLIAPCVSKKRKLLITGPNHSNNLVKHEKLQFSEKHGTHNHQENREMLGNHEIITQKNKDTLINREEAGASQTVPHNGVEKKGSAFLVQVREMLTDVEYKEFVGFMKALKSKAMKIGHVLQSIAKLFSRPERISLLHGFKEYVPAKYHSLYEHYLSANSSAPDV